MDSRRSGKSPDQMSQVSESEKKRTDRSDLSATRTKDGCYSIASINFKGTSYVSSPGGLSIPSTLLQSTEDSSSSTESENGSNQ